MMSAHPKETMKPRRYRARGVWRAGLLADVTCVCFAVLAVVGSGRAHVAGGVAAALFFAWSFPAWRAGLYVYADGVKVCGIVLSKRVPWSDIERFEVRAAGNWPYVGFIVRRGGRRPISIAALSTPGWPKSRFETFRARVQGPVDELNQLLAQWQEAALTNRPPE